MDSKMHNKSFLIYLKIKQKFLGCYNRVDGEQFVVDPQYFYNPQMQQGHYYQQGKYNMGYSLFTYSP